MAVPAVKLNKLRTFHDDFARAKEQQTGEPAAVTQAEPLAAAKQPATAVTTAATVSDDVNQTKPAAAPTTQPAAPASPTDPAGQPVVSTSPAESARPVEMTRQATAIPKNRARGLTAADLEGVRKSGKKSIMARGGKEINVMEAATAGVGEGSIITDRKRERFKLFPAMAEAFRGWLGDTKETVSEMTESKEPVAVVTPASERKGLIVQAAEQSARAPRDDRRNLLERFAKTKPKQLSEHKDTLKIKKREEVPPPTWTHIKDDEAKKTDAAKAAETALKAAAPVSGPARETIAAPVPQPVPASAAPQQSAEVPVPAATPPAAAEAVPAVAEPVAPTTTPIPETIPAAIPATEIPPEPVAEPAVTDIPTPVPAYVPPATPTAAPKAPAVQTRSSLVFSPWRVGAVITFSVLLGVSGALWFFGSGDKETPIRFIEETSIVSLIGADVQIAVPLGTNANEFQRNLLAAEPPGGAAVAELYPTSNISGEAIPAAPEQILTILDLQAPRSFIRSITAINFGFYRDSEPFIIMKTTAFDVAFGGILEWERAMSADLSPFFGAPVSGTFDPQARSASQIREPYFVDVVVNNLDARVLTDETQKERIIYTFTDRNTILITTDEATLEALANEL